MDHDKVQAALARVRGICADATDRFTASVTATGGIRYETRPRFGDGAKRDRFVRELHATHHAVARVFVDADMAHAYNPTYYVLDDLRFHPDEIQLLLMAAGEPYLLPEQWARLRVKEIILAL